MLQDDSFAVDYPIIFRPPKGSEDEALLLGIQGLPQGSEERHEAMAALYSALARAEHRAADEAREKKARKAKAANPRQSKSPALAPAPTRGYDLSEVRAWLRSNGHKVADYGRIPQALLEEYDKAH